MFTLSSAHSVDHELQAVNTVTELAQVRLQKNKVLVKE
jgi:hypothetical protein